MSGLFRWMYPGCSSFLLFILGALLTPAVTADHAADERLLTEQDLLSPLPTVVSATRLEQSLADVPAAVTIIDRAMIEASGAVNIADLFRLVPGFQSYHVNANKFGVVSHGQGNIHPGRLEVMVDGRSVYLALLSTVDWRALGVSLEDIDHIEVVRGSNVPTQGSNAFLGAINIITRHPVEEQGSLISTTRGSLKTQDYYLRHSEQFGTMNVRFNASFHKNNGSGLGYEAGDRRYPVESIEDGGEISHIGFRGSYTPTLSDTIDIQLGISSGQYGVGRSHHPSEFYTRDVDSHFQSIQWTRSISEEEELKLHAYHNYLKYQGARIQEVPESFLLPGSPAFSLDTALEDGVSQRLDIDLEYSRRLSSETRAVWGAGFRFERLESEPLLNGTDATDEWLFRASGNLEHQRSSHWTTNLGAMLEANDITGTRLSPRLGINYHLNHEQSVRASISRAYRTPSLLEASEKIAVVLPPLPSLGPFNSATYNQISQPYEDLQPESASTLELGYLWQELDGRWRLDAKLYVEDVNDGIDDFRVPAADLYDQYANENRNVAEWQTRGAELQLMVRPWQHSWLHLAYAYADAEGQHQEANGHFEDISDRVPKHSLALLASHELQQGLNASLGFYHLSSVTWSGGTETGSYNRLDARLARQFNYGSSEATIEFIIQNLLSTYTEFSLNNDFDTRGFLRLSLGFR